MSQKQFTTYQSDILSFELREAMLGIAKPGRYQGWNIMSSNGSPSGGNIPIRIGHSNPGFKKGSHEVPPVLSGDIGVAISTQGTIIHEDGNIDKNIAINSVASIRWDILYMEHIYSDVSGANNATYGIQQGTAGSGVPTFLNLEKRIILGLIKINASGSIYSSLTYYPKQSVDMFGDSLLAQKLWGAAIAEHILDIGLLPTDGIIGSRNYSEDNTITSGESLTASINKADIILGLHDTRLTDLENNRLDQWATPIDNTSGNVSINHHGLIPKLDNNPYHYFDGTGNWSKPTGKRIVLRSTNVSIDFELKPYLQEMNWYELDLSSIVSSDADLVILTIAITVVNSGTGTTVSLQVKNYEGVGQIKGVITNTQVISEVTLPLSTSKVIRVYGMNVNAMQACNIQVNGWQTAL